MNKAIFILFFLFFFKANAQSFIRDYSELPIKPERTISFTTEEASYIDVDISPDGQTLLCSFLGELFTIPATGGNAKQLTRGLAINRAPVWSPDGKFIAYESDATGIIRLHIMDTLGSFHKVLGEDKPQMENIKPIWFPDSKQIVNDSSIYSIFVANPYVPNEIKNIIGFSPNGNFIYYATAIRGVNYQLIKFEKNTGEKISLIEFIKGPREIKSMKISPNGRWLSYIKTKAGSLISLMLIDLINGKEKSLADLNIKFPAPIDQHYSFSKDSKYIFIGYGGKIHRINIETDNNEVIPFTANVKVDMGPLNYNTFKTSLDPFKVRYIRSINRSPNGKHIIFSALNRIYKMDLPNGKPHVLVNQDAGQFEPAYSPDGKWIAYVSWNDTTGGHVWRIPSKGGSPEKITKVASLYQHPSWSSDGKMIIVAKGNNKLESRDYPGMGQIQIISIKDKSVEIVTDNVSLFNNPNFFSDDKMVLYKPNVTDEKNEISHLLVLHDIKNNRKKAIISSNKNLDFSSSIRQIKLSPDGKNIVFLRNQNLYLVHVANIASTQENFDDTLPSLLIRFARGATDPAWEEGGKVLSWINANKYCRIDPDKIVNAAKYKTPNKSNKGLPESNIIDIDLPVDNMIDINLKMPRLYGKGMLALTNARIITMQGNKVIENGTVLINNGRLVNVDVSDHVNVPAQVKIIDLKGKTIIPGFIDMHSHLYSSVPPDVFLQQSWERLINFSYGVTTIRDPSGSFDTFGYGELVETGQAIGPRLFTVGNAVRTEYSLTSLNEATTIVNNRVKMGARVIKQYQQPTRLQRQLLLLACKNGRVNMTNEVEKNPLYFLGMIKDGSTGIEHNPMWGDIYNDIVTLIAKSGAYITPTLQAWHSVKITQGKYYFNKGYGQYFLDHNGGFIPADMKSYLQKEINDSRIDSGFLIQSRINAAINKAGGKILMGSHGEDQGLGVHYELWALAMGGLTNVEALKTGTITAAEGLGMQKDLGSIEVGKIADLIILDKNPLEDIHNTTSIKYVMKAGVLYESETLDQVWPEKKKCPEWSMKTIKTD